MSPIGVYLKGLLTLQGACKHVLLWAFRVGALCFIVHGNKRRKVSEVHPQPCNLYSLRHLVYGEEGQTLPSADVSGSTDQRRQGLRLYLSGLLCPLCWEHWRQSWGKRARGRGRLGEVHSYLLEKAQASLSHLKLCTWPETTEGLVSCFPDVPLTVSLLP